MKIFEMLKRFKNLESIESAIADAQTELNTTLTQSASVRDEYERKTKELNSEYERKSNELNSTFITEKNRLDQIIKDKNSTIVDLDKKINQSERAINTIEMMDEYGVPDYEDSLDELEHKRYSFQEKIKEILSWGKNSHNGLWYIDRAFTLDGSSRDGRIMQENQAAGYAYALNAYLDKKEKSCTNTFTAQVEREIWNKFELYQKRADKVGIVLNREYVSTRIKIINLSIKIKVLKKLENQRLREEKRRIKEAEQLAKDIEKARREIAADRLKFDKALGRATTEQERQEIKEKLNAVDKREREVDYREQHSRAGWLYVIDTPAMPGMEKLGVTRRLNPLDRVNEMSTAAVPFPFICRAVVFADDVFDIETKIHNYFNDKRVNKENLHKEFFYVTPEEAINVLKDVFKCEIHYIDKTETNEEEENDD